MQWILGSFGRDFGFMYAPALIAIVAAVFVPEITGPSLLYGLAVSVAVDAGHVYSTLWRTYFNPSEIRSRFAYYFWTPVIIGAGFSTWAFFGLPGLWAFVLYANLHHHIRQYYGVIRWYGRLNSVQSKASTYFLWLLTCIPILAYHFRENVLGGYSTRIDFPSYPHPTIFQSLVVVWAITAFAWTFYEVRRFRTLKVYDFNRAFLMFFVLILYGYCFLIGRRLDEVVLPILLGHGVAYFGLMGLSLKRTNRFQYFATAVGVIFLSGLIFGGLEIWVESQYINLSPEAVGKPVGSLDALLIGLYLTPAFTHFVLDSYIWTGRHREGPVIYDHRLG